jgi:hypothetical protein
MPGSSKFARSVRLAWERLRRLGRRPLRQQWLVLEACFTLLSVKAMLIALPFERWRRLLHRNVRSGSRVVERQAVAEIVWAVDRTSQFIPLNLTCLPRALSVQRMLARRRVMSELQIGVARDPSGRFEAHAWVEFEGEVMIGALPGLERFSRLPPWQPSKG